MWVVARRALFGYAAHPANLTWRLKFKRTKQLGSESLCRTLLLISCQLALSVDGRGLGEESLFNWLCNFSFCFGHLATESLEEAELGRKRSLSEHGLLLRIGKWWLSFRSGRKKWEKGRKQNLHHRSRTVCCPSCCQAILLSLVCSDRSTCLSPRPERPSADWLCSPCSGSAPICLV